MDGLFFNYSQKKYNLDFCKERFGETSEQAEGMIEQLERDRKIYFSYLLHIAYPCDCRMGLIETNSL